MRVDDTGGSGIASFDIYVSVGSADYTLWLNGTNALQAIYVGEAGKSYSFYSIATDNVGHRESAPTVADANTTTIALIPGKTHRILWMSTIAVIRIHWTYLC